MEACLTNTYFLKLKGLAIVCEDVVCTEPHPLTPPLCDLAQSFWKTICHYLPELNIHVPYDPAVPQKRARMCTKRHVQEYSEQHYSY